MSKLCVTCSNADAQIGELCRKCYYQNYYQKNKTKYGKNKATGKSGKKISSKKIKFIKSILKTKSNKCITFPFPRDPNGYGTVMYKRKVYGAHRFVCLQVKGKPPTDQKYVAAHNCGNGHLGCVNPNHLDWKSYTGNCVDKIIHGTYGVTLTNVQIREIRQLLNLKFVKLKHIAYMYQCSISTVSDIKRNKAWKALS